MLLSGLNLSTLSSLVITIPRSYRVSTENGWKSVLLGDSNRFNRNQLRLKRLIPIEHDLSSGSELLRLREKLYPLEVSSENNAQGIEKEDKEAIAEKQRPPV